MATPEARIRNYILEQQDAFVHNFRDKETSTEAIIEKARISLERLAIVTTYRLSEKNSLYPIHLRSYGAVVDGWVDHSFHNNYPYLWEPVEQLTQKQAFELNIPYLTPEIHPKWGLQFKIDTGAVQDLIDSLKNPKEYTILTAITVYAPNERIAHEEILEVMPHVDNTRVESWWIADDQRRDGSDNDSAIFVEFGQQKAEQRKYHMNR